MKKRTKKIIIILSVLMLLICILELNYLENQYDGLSQDYVIEWHNKPFKQYEGIKTGSQIKELIQMVNSNNKANPGGIISINDKKEITNYNIDNIIESNKYKVELEYLEDGVINNINIYDNIYYDNEIKDINTNTIENDNIEKDTGNLIINNIKKAIEKLKMIIPTLVIYILLFLFKIISNKIILKKYTQEEAKKKLQKIDLYVYVILCIVTIISFIIVNYYFHSEMEILAKI